MTLSTATVRRGGRQQIDVELEDARRVMATLALDVPYHAIRNDEVLVIEGGGVFYVIGVLRGRGVAKLAADQIRLRAGGRLRVSATERLQVEAKVATLRADRIRSNARAIAQRATTWRREVAGKLGIESDDLDQVVGRWSQTAMRACLKVRGVFRINGRKVNLGGG